MGEGNPFDDPSIFEGIGTSDDTAPPPNTARAASAQLLACEVCDGSFTYAHLHNNGGRVICHDCLRKQKSRAAKAAGMVPDEIQAILAINPWIALAVFTGIFIVGIPLQVWVMIRLANSIETESKWAWIAGAALPWVGLIVLWVFINKVQRIIDQNMPAQRPLTPTEEIKRMGNIGSFLIALNGILSFFLLGHWEYFGILGLVGLAIIAMAYIRRFPYDRKMSNAGFAKLWFADMSDYQKKMSAM